MKSDFILLLILNCFAAIGYSLIAPLYPKMAKEKGIGENICGIAISIYAISNFCITPFCPKIIQIFGRKRLLYLALLIEGSCSFAYGFLNYIDDKSLFIFFSLALRFIHGMGSAFVSCLMCSLTASICSPEEMKTCLGYIELAWCLGMALGPVCASIFYYIGGYGFPFIVCGCGIFICVHYIKRINIIEDVEEENINFLNILFDVDILNIFFCAVFDIFSRTFYYPVLTNHLTHNFGLSMEMSSLIFFTPMITYFLFLQVINKICNAFGLKLTLSIGLFCISLGVLMLPPISLFPSSTITIVVGLLILGIPGALINIPVICDLRETIKSKNQKLEQSTANDIASAVYNMGINFGESIAPIFGGYVTEKQSFSLAAIYTSIISLFFCIYFTVYNIHVIRQDIKHEQEQNINIRESLTRDDYNLNKRKQSHSVNLEFGGRFRSFSYSKKSSQRSSLIK